MRKSIAICVLIRRKSLKMLKFSLAGIMRILCLDKSGSDEHRKRTFDMVWMKSFGTLKLQDKL